MIAGSELLGQDAEPRAGVPSKAARGLIWDT